MLSRDCDGCTQQRFCRDRYRQVTVEGKVYCPDGTAHLVDQIASRTKNNSMTNLPDSFCGYLRGRVKADNAGVYVSKAT